MNNLSIKPQLKALTAVLLEIFGIFTALGALCFDLFTKAISTPRPGNVQILVGLSGISITLLSHFITPHLPLRRAIRSTKAPSFFIFCLSSVLIIINISGLFISLRNPAVYQGISYAGKIRVPKYTAEEFRSQMNRIESIDEQYPEYVTRLTQLIFDSTVHYWQDDETADAFNLHIPIHENYLIYLMDKLRGKDELYEFCQAERAVERSASICSQSSRILANVLIRNGVRAQIAGLDGHVVVQARVDKDTDEWWVLDADYGVVIEHNLNEIAQNPELIRSVYREKGYLDIVIDDLVSFYSPSGNAIIDEKLQCEGENHLYLLKWLIPITGMLPFLSYVPVHYFRQRKTKS